MMMKKTVPCRIARAAAGERDAVAEFVLRQMAKLYPPGAYNHDPEDLKRFGSCYIDKEEACFLVARDDSGFIVGTAAVRPYNRRFAFLEGLLPDGEVCEITKVYIGEDRRKQGIGSALYREAEAFARQAGYRVSYLHTSLFLPGGYPFWLSRGYAVKYRESEAVVHMAKPL